MSEHRDLREDHGECRSREQLPPGVADEDESGERDTNRERGGDQARPVVP
jgi:hypothetical protein